jgi:glyoxylase I family protein
MKRCSASVARRAITTRRHGSNKRGATVFAPFPSDTEYFGNPGQAWMINFRVANLDRMITQLRAKGIEVTLDPEIYPNGRFARLNDPERNPIELWEPKADS